MRAGETAMVVIAIILSIGWIVSIPVGMYVQWQIEKDTDAWLERAQVASDPVDMKEYLVKCRDGMIKWDCATGYAAVIFNMPSNDMVLIMRALDRSITRCEQVGQFDPVSVEYQVALDDIRGQLRELDLNMPYCWWVAHISHIIFALWIYFGWIVAIIAWAAFDCM